MTKSELIAKRDATYREPPEKRCETCRFSLYRPGSHRRCAVGGMESVYCGDNPKQLAHIAGVCDLWEPKHTEGQP